MKRSLSLLLVLVVFCFTSAFAQEKAEGDKKEDKKDKKALPLIAERNVSFNTDEVTWMSLDVSPDGKTIVFDAAGDLYTLPINGGKATRISSGMSYDAQPRYSPDGTKIVYLSDRSGSENLYLLEVGKVVNDTTKYTKETGLTALTKGKNGGAGRGAYISPEFTPDGKYVIVTIGSGTGSQHLWMLHVDGGKGVDLFKGKTGIRGYGAAFGNSERFVYFAHLRRSQGLYNQTSFGWQLAKYDRETGEIFGMTGEVGAGFRPALSSDGKWLVYASRFEEQTGLRVRDMDSGDERWLKYPVQRDDMESRGSRDLLPGYSFTPDNKSIIISYGGKLHKVDVSNGKEKEIKFNLDIDLEMGPRVHFENEIEDGAVKIRQVKYPKLSPDGNSMVFTALDKLYIRNIASGMDKRLTDLKKGEFAPDWSPDGMWVSFVTWSEEVGGEVYKVKSDGSGLTKISRVNAYYSSLVWTPDGSGVMVSKGLWQQRSELSNFNRMPTQGSDLVFIPAEGGEDRLITPLKGGGKPHFADKSDRLYIYESRELISMRMDGTDRKKHLKVTGSKVRGSTNPSRASEILMSPDGEHALVLSSKHLFRVVVPQIGGDAPTISVANPKSSAFPVVQLTSMGGVYDMNFNSDGTEAIWQVGPTIFRYNFADAKLFADNMESDEEESNDESDKDEDKDKEKESYAATQTTIELEFPRYKGQGTIVLRGARLITMDTNVSNDGVIEDGAIVVVDNRITQVGKSSDITKPRGAREIDVKGKTIVPGFIDAHAHMWPAWGVHRGVVWEYLANLSYGITMTQDVQTSQTDVLTYSDLVETGELVGPRIYHTGPGVFSGDLIKNKKDAAKVLKRYTDYYRINSIKQYVAGDRDVRQMIIMEAKKAGLMPTYEGALDLKMNFTNIIDGYPGHEHSFPIAPLYKDFYQVAAESQILYTPTLIVSYGGPWAEEYFYKRTNVHDDEKLRRFFPHSEIDKLTRRRSNWFREEEHVFPLLAKQANKIVEAGGKVGVGGHGQLNGLGWHWELWAIQSGGMTEMNALRCATIFGAEGLGYGKDLGSLVAGKLADFVVLDKNPLDDIKNTVTTKFVMKNGLLYEADTLDQIWPKNKKLPTPYWQKVDKEVNKNK